MEIVLKKLVKHLDHIPGSYSANELHEIFALETAHLLQTAPM
jgi:hypothetical protein